MDRNEELEATIAKLEGALRGLPRYDLERGNPCGYDCQAQMVGDSAGEYVRVKDLRAAVERGGEGSPPAGGSDD